MAMKSALLRGELSEFGSLLGEAWKQKKRMSPLIAHRLHRGAVRVAMRAGALGGKVTGAGGGGYILFYCDFARKHRLAEALTRMGGVVTDVAFERRGPDHLAGLSPSSCAGQPVRDTKASRRGRGEPALSTTSPTLSDPPAGRTVAAGGIAVAAGTTAPTSSRTG